MAPQLSLLKMAKLIIKKYNLDDLLQQLREKGERNIENIEYAILENNGKLSIFTYNNKKNSSPFPMPLIIDGVIKYDTLKYIHQDKSFIEKILATKKIKLKNIFYAFYKDKEIFIIKYKDLK